MKLAARTCAALLLLALARTIRRVQGFELGPKPAAAPGLIVKIKPDAVFTSAGGTGTARPISLELNLYRVNITDGKPAKVKAAELEKLEGVAYAVPDDWVHVAIGRGLQARAGRRRPPAPKLKRRPPMPRPKRRRPPPGPQLSGLGLAPPPPKPKQAGAKRPNDKFYRYQWGMDRIRAPGAWALRVDSSSVPTCIVDTGVMYNHPDLAPNLVPMTAEWQRENFDDSGHGTHIAGIIGAMGNNQMGLTGVGWRASILSCKALDSTGWGLISKVLECIQWCRSQGARVINTSFELASQNAALEEAVRDGTAAGTFFAAAAGNSFWQNDNDVVPIYPASFKFPGNVAVANVAEAGGLGDSSNYGGTTVHVAAPGTEILSTWITRNVEESPPTLYSGQFYRKETGTSMAAPYVAGAAALAIAASGGTLTNAEVAELLVKTSIPVPELRGLVLANGVINLEALIKQAIQHGQQARAVAAAAKGAASRRI